jgi:hypothetical protein
MNDVDEVRHAVHPGPQVAAAPRRRSAVGARTAGSLVAAALVGVGVALAQEACAAAGAFGLRPEDGWVRSLLERLDGLRLTDAAYAVAALAVLLGAALLVAAWRAGPSPSRVAAAPVLELYPQDVARLASTAAEDVDGVLSASSTATRRSVVVRVRTTGDPAVPGDVAAVVGRRLAGLDPAPQVRVRAVAGGAP